jgi:hypothetical protein
MAKHDNAVRSTLNGNIDKSQRTRVASPRRSFQWWLVSLLCAGLMFGAAPRAAAQPVENRIYSGCTFTIPDLQDLEIADLESLNGGQLQASYIIIYVRENPNDGQEIGTTGTFTGPILCTNADTDMVVPTTEDTLIPDSGTVDILGAEEASHLQYEPTGGDPEKRVCHTVAGNTDCFLIRPSASPPPLE